MQCCATYLFLSFLKKTINHFSCRFLKTIYRFFYRFGKTINRFDVRIVANFMNFTQTQPLSNVEPTMCSVRKQKPLRVRIQTNNNSNALNYCFKLKLYSLKTLFGGAVLCYIGNLVKLWLLPQRFSLERGPIEKETPRPKQQKRFIVIFDISFLKRFIVI